jgi:hypothetical protein
MTKLSIRLGQGIVQVLQLDDPGCQSSYGVEINYPNKYEVEIAGSRYAMEELYNACADRAEGGGGEGWDQPLWYTRSASAAAKKLKKLIISQS